MQEEFIRDKILGTFRILDRKHAYLKLIWQVILIMSKVSNITLMNKLKYKKHHLYLEFPCTKKSLHRLFDIIAAEFLQSFMSIYNVPFRTIIFHTI